MRNIILAALAFLATACGSKEINKTVSTEELGSGISGFAGPTPVVVTIEKGIITSVEALPNYETPGYFTLVEEQLLPRWVGMTVQEALDTELDAVSGATYSSNAVKKNVLLALEKAAGAKPEK